MSSATDPQERRGRRRGPEGISAADHPRPAAAARIRSARSASSRPEGMDRDHLPPARVGAPRGGGWLAAREHHDVLGLQGRDEFLAQPAVDGTELLVPVHQQHGPASPVAGPRVLGGMNGAGGLGGLAETVRRGIDLAPVQQSRGPPSGASTGPHLEQQRGLAHAARAVDEQHSPRRTAGPRIVEGLQLGSPADEASPPRAVDDVTQAGRRHQFSLPPGRDIRQHRRRCDSR